MAKTKWGIRIIKKPFINWRNPSLENLNNELFIKKGARLNKIGSIDGVDVCRIYWQSDFIRANKNSPFLLCPIIDVYSQNGIIGVEFKDLLNAMKSANEHCGFFLFFLSKENDTKKVLFEKYYQAPDLKTEDEVYDIMCDDLEKGQKIAWSAIMYGFYNKD